MPAPLEFTVVRRHRKAATLTVCAGAYDEKAARPKGLALVCALCYDDTHTLRQGRFGVGLAMETSSELLYCTNHGTILNPPADSGPADLEDQGAETV